MLEKFKQLPAQYKALMLFVLLGIISAILAWYDDSPTSSKELTKAKPIVTIPKVDTPVINGTVKTIPKAKVAKKIKLPSSISDDPNTEVVDTAEAPPSENGTEIVAAIDKTTGNVTTYTKEKEASLFAFENKKRIGIGYGVNSDSGHEVKLFGEYTFIRVGNLHGSFRAEANNRAEAGVMATIDYRW